MIIVRQTIAPPFFADTAIQGLISVMERRDALPNVTASDRVSAVSAAVMIERWSQGVWWAGAEGARDCETIAEVSLDDVRRGPGRRDWWPAVPSRDLATAAVTAVDLWDRDGAAWTAVPLVDAPLGWAPRDGLSEGQTLRIRATATAPDPAPGAVEEALRRLYGWRVQYEPVRGDRDSDPVPLGDAMRRSGALGALTGAGYKAGGSW